jgi:hypothetical protein
VFLDAARDDDLEKLKRLIAEGADLAEADDYGFTELLQAAVYGRIPIMHWLLTEGGSSLTEQTIYGTRALSLAARSGRFPAMQYLLKERGASLNECDNYVDTGWGIVLLQKDESVTELSSLLKVMMIFEDAPADFIIRLSPKHTDICTQGRQFRHNCRPISRSGGLRSSHTAPCLPCSNLSSLRTPRPPRRTCGRTGCACMPPESKGFEQGSQVRQRVWM